MYAIVDYPIIDSILKSGKIPQTNKTARTNRNKTKCIVSFNDAYLDLFRNYATLQDDELLDYITGLPGEWDYEYVEPNKTVSIEQVDKDTGSVSSSPKFAPDGWYQQLFETEMETSRMDSIHEKDWQNNDIGWSTLRFWKIVNGSEIVCIDQPDIDANCIRTDLEWMPNIDYMIKGGFIGQLLKPNTNVYAWTQGVVLPAFAGGVQATFSEGGINMAYVDAYQRVGMDGVAGTILYYSHPALGPGMGTNKIRFVFRHPAGFKHRFQCIFDIFRES